MSKFGRVIALSRKPSDFPPQKTKDTVPLERAASPGPSRGTVPLVPEGLRLHRCIKVQDGHSFAEDRLYQALWNASVARRENDDSRLVTMGWDVMARAAGMTPRNVRENCFRLIAKLALEKVQGHVSEARIGTTYRIYSYQVILKRRRAAGLEWVVRNRGGVSFVQAPSRDTVPLQDTVPSQDTGTVPSKATGTVPSEATPFSQTGVKPKTTSSPALRQQVARTIRVHLAADDDAVSRLVQRCLEADPAATPDEICHFVEVKVAQHRRMQRVQNPIGLLIEAVPKCFSGDMIQDYRRECRDRGGEGTELARRTLHDPQATESERELARAILDGLDP